MKTRFSVFLTCFLLLSTQSFVLASGEDSEKGYGGIPWGISCRNFQNNNHSESLGLMDVIRARAVDYLMMDFHEVALDDSSRPQKFSVQKMKGDDTAYVFYDGKYCLASVPIDVANIDAVQKKLEKGYRRLGGKTYQSYLEFEGGDYGWKMLTLEYSEFQKKPKTRVYFVKASTYYDEASASSEPAGGFLIYVPEDYFKNTAYMEWQANKSMAPEMNKKKIEQKARQDISRVE